MAEVVAAVTVAATVMDPVVLADGTSSHEDVVTTQTVLPQNPLDDSLISQIQLASLEFSVEKIVDSVIARVRKIISKCSFIFNILTYFLFLSYNYRPVMLKYHIPNKGNLSKKKCL